ncbi:MAG: glycosyl hydrolase family 95 catalytic domain-containing protein [Armatimonadota bacterium]
MINTAFDPKDGSWLLPWPERISQYDVVYLSPPLDPMQGLPLGNGDLGALCWCSESQLIIQLNKCDLWDDADFTHFSVGAHGAEEACTALKHGGRLIIDFGLPVFDHFYLSDFRGRISLADATISLEAEGPFGRVAVFAFISRESGVLWLDIESALQEAVPVEVTLERFGSRIFSRWYSQVNRDPALGLQGTTTCHDAKGIYISQQVSGGAFAVGCQVVAGAATRVETETLHSRAGRIRLSSETGVQVSLVAGAVSPSMGDVVRQVRSLLADAREVGKARLLAAHAEEWKVFWLRSLMDCGDDYLNTLWHLTMYYLNASQRGAYPGRFINGLWGWNRDVQPWNVYFHWNQQTLYWPLNAAGHHDLLQSYLEFRFRALPHAREDARNIFGAEGAFVCDLVERRGYNSASERGNHTPVAEIALDFWRQYHYTGDRQFLQERAVPYLIEAALFLASCFELQEDGRYHAKEGTALEGWIAFVDATSELVYGHALFATVLEALAEAEIDHPHASRWREILDKLIPLPVIEAGDDVIAREDDRWVLRHGWYAGEEAEGNKMLSAGFRTDSRQWVPSLSPTDTTPPPMPDVHDLIPYIEKQYLPQYTPMGYTGIFPEVEYLSIFPAGLLGIDQQETELFQAAVNTARLYAPGLGGYDRTAVVLARLGRGREAWQVIDKFPYRWQVYCNGFGHYNWGMKADQALRFRINQPVDVDSETGQTIPMYSWPFRHMGMESMSVLCCALNECLLQSYDGKLRIGPALREGQQARFTLHAVGGFVVSAEIREGVPSWIAVTSRLGNTCRIANPWPRCHLSKNGIPLPAAAEPIIEVPTMPGDRLLLAPDEELLANWQCEPAICTRNEAPKVREGGHPVIGLPRLF